MNNLVGKLGKYMLRIYWHLCKFQEINLYVHILFEGWIVQPSFQRSDKNVLLAEYLTWADLWLPRSFAYVYMYSNVIMSEKNMLNNSYIHDKIILAVWSIESKGQPSIKGNRLDISYLE